MISGLAHFAVAEGWGQLAFFGFIGFLLFAAPAIEPISRPTLVSAVLVVLYLMTPLDIILTWVPVLGRAQVSLQRVQALIPTLERHGDSGEGRSMPVEPLELRDSICLEGVTFTYRDGNDEAGFLLGPIDLTLRPGELVILAGGNGSGKTTLVKLLAGLYRPESGAVRIDGHRIADEDREAYRQLFSIVFADGHLFRDFRGLKADGIATLACEGLERLGLAPVVSVRGSSFSTLDLSQGSGGDWPCSAPCWRIGPSASSTNGPPIRIPSFKQVFYHKLLPELRAAGKALLVISHDESHFDIADRVIRLQDGRLVEESPLADRWRVGLKDSRKDARMKKLLVLMVVLWGGGGCGVWYWTDARTQRVSYRTVTIKRGDLGSTINATGTIEPEEVVDVGAQVAGRIESFAADPLDPSKTVGYGSHVEQGTVLARLDSALFQARLDQARGRVAKAEADIEQAQAKLRQADRELDRCRKLMVRERRSPPRNTTRPWRTTSRPRRRWQSIKAR